MPSESVKGQNTIKAAREAMKRKLSPGNKSNTIQENNKCPAVRTETHTQIEFLRWSNVGSTLYTAMAHGWHTTLGQCTFDH